MPAINDFDTNNHFFTISQMVIPGASYWNVGIGREIGDVKHDEERIHDAHPWSKHGLGVEEALRISICWVKF